MKKTIIVTIIVALVSGLIIYDAYTVYKIKTVSERDDTVLQYLFTPDKDKITGFTKETVNSINIINQANQKK